MGVFDRARDVTGGGAPDARPYICMGCEAGLEVQYHTCPSCGGYDVRRTEWLGE